LISFFSRKYSFFTHTLLSKTETEKRPQHKPNYDNCKRQEMIKSSSYTVRVGVGAPVVIALILLVELCHASYLATLSARSVTIQNPPGGVSSFVADVKTDTTTVVPTVIAKLNGKEDDSLITVTNLDQPTIE